MASRLESIAKPGSILISFDTFSQVSEEIKCINIEAVRVKGIKEEVRTFEVVLHEIDYAEMVNIETENLKCSIDLNGLKIEEIDQLTKFVQETKQRIKGN